MRLYLLTLNTIDVLVLAYSRRSLYKVNIVYTPTSRNLTLSNKNMRMSHPYTEKCFFFFIQEAVPVVKQLLLSSSDDVN